MPDLLDRLAAIRTHLATLEAQLVALVTAQPPLTEADIAARATAFGDASAQWLLTQLQADAEAHPAPLVRCDCGRVVLRCTTSDCQRPHQVRQVPACGACTCTGADPDSGGPVILRLSKQARQRCEARLHRPLAWTHQDLELRWKHASGGFTTVTDEEYAQVCTIPGVVVVQDPDGGPRQGSLEPL